MQVESYCPAEAMPRLQELIKHYNLRWIYNPYPTNPRKPGCDWRVGIDYTNATPEDSLAFDLAWVQLKTPIVEKVKKYSLLHKLKVWLKSVLKPH